MKKQLTSKQRAYLSVLGMFIIASGSGFAGAFSLFYIPVTAELGFKQAEFAGYMTIMSLMGIVMHPFVGVLITKYARHLKLICMSGAVVGLAACLWFSRSSHLIEFYLGGAVISFTVPIVSIILGSTVMTNWFAVHRSVAISIVSIGVSLGTILYTQFGRFAIEAYGWRKCYMLLGVMLFAGTLIGTIFVSAPPEAYGLKPYGYERAQKKEIKIGGLTFKQLVKTPGFWIYAFGCGVASAYIMAMQQSILPMMQVDFQFTAAAAANILSIYSLVVAASKLLMGIIYDKGGMKASMSFVFVLVTAGFLTLILFRGNQMAGVIGVILYAIGNVFGTIVMPNYLADVSSATDYGTSLGFINVFFTIGTAIGPLVAGASVDISGSYGLGTIIFCLFCLINTLCTFGAYFLFKKQGACR